MASAMNVFRKFRSSDGRIKIVTLSGVSALVAVIALLVGVLPVMADHDGDHPLVDPGDPIAYGGGSGACESVGSVADEELHINNPIDGTYTGADGTMIKIDVEGQRFSFEVLTPGMGVFDAVVNGGPHNLHYPYFEDLRESVTYDEGLHAPLKNKDEDLNNLSHINLCYDFDSTEFECGIKETKEQEGLFTLVAVTIFANKDVDCETKLGVFFVDNTAGEVTVGFEDDGEGTTAGRAEYTKVFDSGGDFVPLRYDGPGEFVDLQWCEVDPKDEVLDPVTGLFDGDEFNDWLGNDEYPSLDGVRDVSDDGDDLGPATACKVYEEEDASGLQYTVVYFEFVDPNFH